ncbi:hypothetical protein SAMN05660653_01556 [Desulfonatronum thiosulfatophilum]|uniref:Uncharacterized protein n=1 Tax=Desulfonatronum thiosulfatophilum TaxID=617002 RepID=A0A1G6CIL8_9BACT|nr:hypothetical protein [Desulfonatronum thiosulfatophilum]SDB32730.1 hypothetical protein SAMN05660653_01556 [Desulfonatronum thiosulfatophilum]
MRGTIPPAEREKDIQIREPDDLPVFRHRQLTSRFLKTQQPAAFHPLDNPARFTNMEKQGLLFMRSFLKLLCSRSFFNLMLFPSCFMYDNPRKIRYVGVD